MTFPVLICSSAQFWASLFEDLPDETAVKYRDVSGSLN
jgi:hypothetical protein